MASPWCLPRSSISSPRSPSRTHLVESGTFPCCMLLWICHPVGLAIPKHYITRKSSKLNQDDSQADLAKSSSQADLATSSSQADLHPK
eukprot:6425599-Alexandrium_andersonii.AAC.1